MRRVLLDDTSRWSLSSPDFDLRSSAFVGLDDVFCSHFSRFTFNRFSRIRILRCTFQLYRLLQYSNWSFCFTFLRLLVGLSFCLNTSETSCVVMYTSFFSLVIQTHEGCQILHNGFSWNFTLTKWVFLFTVWPLNGMRRRSLLSSLFFALVSRS